MLIKSSEKKQLIIKKIIEHAPNYKKYSFITEELLAEILINTLALFGDEKEYWLDSVASLLEIKLETNSPNTHKDTLSLLAAFFAREQQFLEAVSPADLSSFSSYLAARTIWFTAHKNVVKDSTDTATAGISSSIDIDSAYVDSEFLNTYAYNMTTRIYHTNPAIGREQEIADLELILISPKKSPLLIGDAGVGKTSVVEGLAYRLQKGNVPDLF